MGTKRSCYSQKSPSSPDASKIQKKVPIPYNFSANAWMTCTIFEKMVNLTGRCLQMKKRKVVLLVHNCFAHYSSANLNNISLRFLPPNTTSVLQSCDMGTIRTLKAYFRHEMHQKIIDDSENELAVQTVVKRINLLDAMHMINPAWAKVQMSQSESVEGKEILLPRN